jgi:2'-5' RNA ligase
VIGEPVLSHRLFFALWPDEAVRTRVAAARIALASCRGKAVRSANYHVTLAFLGEIPVARLDCLLALGDGLGGKAFSLNLDTFGYFPKAHVVWLGSSLVPPELTDLYQRLAGALPRCELAPEARPYHPHVTLVRKAMCGPDPAASPAIPWCVREYALIESAAMSGGSSYRVLRRWPLS